MPPQSFSTQHHAPSIPSQCHYPPHFPNPVPPAPYMPPSLSPPDPVTPPQSQNAPAPPPYPSKNLFTFNQYFSPLYSGISMSHADPRCLYSSPIGYASGVNCHSFSDKVLVQAYQGVCARRKVQIETGASNRNSVFSSSASDAFHAERDDHNLTQRPTSASTEHNMKNRA